MWPHLSRWPDARRQDGFQCEPLIPLIGILRAATFVADFFPFQAVPSTTRPQSATVEVQPPDEAADVRSL